VRIAICVHMRAGCEIPSTVSSNGLIEDKGMGAKVNSEGRPREGFDADVD
jgi:hypothetical protein